MFDYVEALDACSRGDREALKRLYDVEAARLVSVAQRIVRRQELAEDIVHDAFVQIWTKAGSFDPELGSARGWIYTIVRNRALNAVRDGGRIDLMDPATLAAFTDRSAVIDDAFVQLDSSSRLRRCLEGMEQEKRDSVLLSYVAGCSHGEIAGVLGVPLGTAKSWVRRGLTALKDCMS
ncbi:RNA polymerase sigma-70 factor, ECF subfamily [Filomicrobium insigne]|uniref:RNA polymerase sigma-70 factor, ECF subfamily n=1 Tax=Filomicrobium insigne TaxID=418854 RepID=A0A1H0I4X9_9HYPH|nr:sigma-70 family RNA polymerase sigma factor [Filomicrobium insigne]SDO26423.1 RNA polymerase sigma-70 factor, ECF subfamily [Filomicrobium insigne]